MLDVGWPELLMIAAVAIIVVGPKDLPKMLRSLGQWMSKARSMAREFQRGFDEMAKESELAELRKGIEDLKANNPIADAKRELEGTLESTKKAIKPASSVEEYFGGMDPTGASDEDLAKIGQPPSQADQESGAAAHEPTIRKEDSA